MKTMTVTYHFGEGSPSQSRKASSQKIANMFCAPAHEGRLAWAQLIIHLDGITLNFWLPEELDHVCDVFSMRPFPSVRSLIKNETDETLLNFHWLSKLPKKAKSPKFREKFLKLIKSNPQELTNFRRHYTH